MRNSNVMASRSVIATSCYSYVPLPLRLLVDCVSPELGPLLLPCTNNNLL